MRTTKSLNIRTNSIVNANCPMSILRLRTSAAHQEIEKTLLIGKLMSQDLTLDTYRDVLLGWQLWLTVNERKILNMLSELSPSDIGQRAKLILIEQDLLQLNTSELKPLAHGSSPLILHNAYEAIGALYVLEGATLGGQLILKRLRSQLKENMNHHFYSSYKEKTTQMWSAFNQYVNSTIITSYELEAAVTGARNTFSSLTHTFNTTNKVNINETS